MPASSARRKPSLRCNSCGKTKPISAFPAAHGQSRTRCDSCRRSVVTAPTNAFVRRGPDGMTGAEVAAALGVSLQAVNQTEIRALRKLRKVLIALDREAG